MKIKLTKNEIEKKVICQLLATIHLRDGCFSDFFLLIVKRLCTHLLQHQHFFSLEHLGTGIFQIIRDRLISKQPIEGILSKYVLKNYATFIGKHLC